MTVALVILTLLIALLLFLVFTPVTLKIDTYSQQYYLQIWGIAKCSFVWENGPIIRLRVPFYTFRINPLALRTKKKKKPKRKRKAETKKKRSFMSFKKVLKLIRSFEMKEFRLELDTGNVIGNAYLFPVFFFLNRQKAQLRINYEGSNGLVIWIENRGVRMIRAFLS